MHNAAFRALNINSVYLAFNVTDVAGAMEGVRCLGIAGLSVTIPHKETIIQYLDEIDPVAQKIGAVNTVINRDGFIYGTNTDWLGAVKALGGDTITGQRVLVLGAGGSAKAVAVGLQEKGAEVIIANRTKEKALALAALCGGKGYGLDEVEEIEADILVNTTPLGMAPEVDKCPLAPSLLSKFKIVMDIVYSPLETKLLTEAKKAGCKTINGLYMLLYQAIAQFELWTQRTAPVDVIKKAINL